MKMTNREVIDFLKVISKELQLKNSLNKRVGIDSEDKFTGNGSTISYFDTVIGSSIGIKELCDNPDARTDNYTFMKAFISILHEYTHIYQREILLHEKGNTSNFIALGYLAGSASEKYYKDNYKYMPDEIAAQYSALKNGYNILSQFVGSKKANSMICDYVNKHIKDEFISESDEDESEKSKFEEQSKQQYKIQRKPEKVYSNVKDIFDDYEKVFKKSRTVKRKFKVDEYRRVIAGLGISQDEVYISDVPMKWILKNSEGKLNVMLNAKPGIYQDFVMAKGYLMNEDPCDWENLEALSNINFTYKIPSLKKIPEQMRFLNLPSVTPEFSFSKDDLQDKDEYNFDDFDI